MTLAIAFLLAATFVISVGGLALLIWALANDQFQMGQQAARTIFSSGEIGRVEDPGAAPTARARMQDEREPEQADSDEDAAEFEARARADASTRVPVNWWLASSVFWLVFGSIFGMIASVKLHLPDWLVQDAALTFGRLRPAHLNTVAYGWASMAGVGVGVWLIPRLFKTEMLGGRFATAGAIIWNIGVVIGTVAIVTGHSDGMEWLEFPWQADVALVAGGALATVPLILSLLKRRVHHLYVSSWYLLA
ncbi:MAG: cbb3-type cytochrome c oxidase subunit I, partial [Pseudomonadota bacterium]